MWHYDDWRSGEAGHCLPDTPCAQRSHQRCEYQNTDGENGVSFDCSTEVCYWNVTSCLPATTCTSPTTKETCEGLHASCSWTCYPIIPPFNTKMQAISAVDDDCPCSHGFGCKWACSEPMPEGGTWCPKPSEHEQSQ